MGDKLNGGILLPWFGSTCPHRVKGHYESLWSCLDWSVLCSDNTFLSWWEWFLLLLPRDNHPQGMRAHLNGLMRMKMIGYILVTRSQQNWTLMWDFVRPMLSSTIIKTPDGGISFHRIWDATVWQPTCSGSCWQSYLGFGAFGKV